MPDLRFLLLPLPEFALLPFGGFLFRRLQSVELLLPLDQRCNSHIFRRNRRSDDATGRAQPEGNHDHHDLHDNIRSSCLMRCSTCPLAVPPIWALRSIAACTVSRAKTPFSKRSEN